MEANGIAAKSDARSASRAYAREALDAPTTLRAPTSASLAEGKKPVRPQSGYWRILSQCEILNFAALRRHLGRPRADALVLDVAARVAEVLPDVRILTAGRALIEIGFEREAPEEGAADIDRLRKALARSFDLDGEAYQLQMQFGVAAAPCEDCDDVRLTEAAESALDQARSEKKVVMPGTDGFETIRRIRARDDEKGELPIIVVTADTAVDLRERCMGLGADDVLFKPVAMDALFDSIGRVLASRDGGILA